MKEKRIRFSVGKRTPEVSAILWIPQKARCLLVMAHGAAAGMEHPFMSAMAGCLAREGLATLRYHFPYMEEGKKAIDRPPLLVETVRSAVAAAAEYGGGLPLLAGGKSLGGRMTSTAASQGALPGVRGLVFFGFPLHAPGKPPGERADHLFKVRLPMLFLQGTRDALADLSLMGPLCERLQGDRPVTLRIIEGADHGFQVPKKSGRTQEEVWGEMGKAVSEWASALHSR
jgi:uncharacterized protein